MNEVIKLKSDKEIPVLGFGTWKLQGDSAFESTSYALEIGYRHIDTAELYGNHKEVGKAMRESSISREEIYLTSKLWRSDIPKERVRPALEKALTDLGQDYLDLYLIHWPDSSHNMDYTIEQMIMLMEEGLIRSVGVSNFTIKHLEKLATRESIEVNQVEFHPSLNQKALLEYCEQENIVLTAYSPIAQGEDLKLKPIEDIANNYAVSTSQIILAWLRQKKIVSIPRSSRNEHIKDNYNSLEISLSSEELAIIDALNTNNRLVHPEFSEFN